MIVGIDFDNTIVSYDGVFHDVAMERGLIDGTCPRTKTGVRDHLRRCGREDQWTALQGTVYGACMDRAQAFPGVKEVFGALHRNRSEVFIVSHKTRRPYVGEPYDLHAAAQAWLESQDFAFEMNHVFFEETKADKLRRIENLQCDYFIDDLPEFLAETSFPSSVTGILFDPHDIHHTETLRAISWSAIGRMLCP